MGRTFTLGGGAPLFFSKRADCFWLLTAKPSSAMGTLGDLFESSIKRRFDKKCKLFCQDTEEDFWIDFDSLIVVIPTFMHYCGLNIWFYDTPGRLPNTDHFIFSTSPFLHCGSEWPFRCFWCHTGGREFICSWSPFSAIPKRHPIGYLYAPAEGNCSFWTTLKMVETSVSILCRSNATSIATHNWRHHPAQWASWRVLFARPGSKGFYWKTKELRYARQREPFTRQIAGEPGQTHCMLC